MFGHTLGGHAHSRRFIFARGPKCAFLELRKKEKINWKREREAKSFGVCVCAREQKRKRGKGRATFSFFRLLPSGLNIARPKRVSFLSGFFARKLCELIQLPSGFLLCNYCASALSQKKPNKSRCAFDFLHM